VKRSGLQGLLDAFIVVIALVQVEKAPWLLVPLAVVFGHRLAFELARSAHLRRDPSMKQNPGPWTTWLFVTRTLVLGLAVLVAPLAYIAVHPTRAAIAFGSIFAFVGLTLSLGGLEVVAKWWRAVPGAGETLRSRRLPGRARRPASPS
jgi:hypothetical protein